MKKIIIALALAASPAFADHLPAISNRAVSQPGPNHVLQTVRSGTQDGIQSVMSNYGENHTVRVSGKYPNIIMTPFAKPQVVGPNENVSVGNNGSNIIVELTGNKPVWLSIVDFNNPTGTPISLTLRPVNSLKSQTIVVSLGNKSPADRANPAKAASGNEYVERINAAFAEIVNGRIPQGYSVRPLSGAPAFASGMQARPVEMYSSYDNDILRYRVTNTTGTYQRLTEEQFGGNNRVMGVTMFPLYNLQPGQSTDVMIMVGKAAQ